MYIRFGTLVHLDIIHIISKVKDIGHSLRSQAEVWLKWSVRPRVRAFPLRVMLLPK